MYGIILEILEVIFIFEMKMELLMWSWLLLSKERKIRLNRMVSCYCYSEIKGNNKIF